ncbi:MAG: hypothetical protein J6X70_11030 [Muribaculaceae bacterium]|nr:hypothetical protein [Muribaculaceae bacterium]
MKQYYIPLSLMLLVVILNACAPVEDDIFTTARITITTGDDTSITGVQAQAKLTNVNTRQVTSSADFVVNNITLELLRGAYQIDIEGVVACVSQDGTTRHRQFRCQCDYAEFASRDMNEITLNIIFLD